MLDGASISAKWLNDEDSRCFDDRRSRLDWLASNTPSSSYWAFPGGLLAKSLFEEARYSFVYGQFLATTLLGLAYIELTLGALFYGSGRNDLKRVSISKLLEEAHVNGLISNNEFLDLDRVRSKRNAYAHFREPGHEESIEYQAVRENEQPYDIVERDAAAVMTLVLRMVEKNAI